MSDVEGPVPTTDETKEPDKVEQWMDDHQGATVGLGCLTLLVILAVIFAIGGALSGDDDKPASSPKKQDTKTTKAAKPAKPKVSDAQKHAALVAKAQTSSSSGRATVETQGVLIW